MPGLGVIDAVVTRFDSSLGLAVPHMGWNGINVRRSQSGLLAPGTQERLYFVHSYMARTQAVPPEWVLATCNYGTEFVAAVHRGNVFATQFHPEKSGKAGLAVIQRFLQATQPLDALSPLPGKLPTTAEPTALAPRVIACLDVRSNDDGDLVVTKGDQ